jgi:hypothetical protein
MIDGLTTKITACTFGALLAVMLGPAAVAHADAKDDEFTNFLTTHGINVGTASQTGNIARELCNELDAGNSQADEEDQLTGPAPKLSQEQAAFFVGAATAAYCPSHTSGPPAQ